MRTAIVVFYSLSLSGHVFAQAEIFNPMKDAIKLGDATSLVKTFAQSVDINIEGNINTYSKAQSEFVLKEFFKKLSMPIAKNVTLKIEGIEAYDVYPKKIPDLYHGYPIRIYGR